MSESFNNSIVLLGELINEYKRIRDISSINKIGRYEADVAAFCLVELAVAYAWSVHILGKYDANIPAGATSCARSAFELGALAAWLSTPEDPFEREGRWLGYYQANVRFYKKLSQDIAEKAPHVAIELSERSEVYANWLNRIKEIFKGSIINKPSMLDILTELGSVDLYPAYRTASQLVHGEPDALKYICRKEYVKFTESETEGVFEISEQVTHFGNFSEQSNWGLPIRMAT